MEAEKWRCVYILQEVSIVNKILAWKKLHTDSKTSSTLARGHCSCNQSASGNGVLITFQDVITSILSYYWVKVVLRGMFCLTIVRRVPSLWCWQAMLTRAISASLDCYAKIVQSAWGVQKWTFNRGNWETILLLPNTSKYSFTIAVLHHLFGALCQFTNFQQLLSRDLTALFLL